jgi:class 3 adenylate cyclase/tetratricopeptide (TPR) repeat protein
MLSAMTCAVCGEPLAEGARFCSNCGAPVSTSFATEERKMVTVLFADLVDSTGLAQRLDPERARELLGGFFDAATEELQALRGQPEKFIGDAVMAVFGLPQVHEDDAVRAVRAGLAIRARTRRLGRSAGMAEPLEVRIGVESGVAATGLGPSGQLLVTGSVVNAAARLQGAAEPGEVLVGETTHELTLSSVSFGERREVRAKGFEHPLGAHPVESLTARSTRRTIPVVGRTNEITILRDSLARVIETSRPLLFTLLGEPGIGKSRVSDEFMAGLDPGVITMCGRSQSYTDSATFAPAAAMVRELAGLDDGAADVDLERLHLLVERYCAPSDVERVTERLALALGIGERRRDESAFVQDVQGGFLTLIESVSARAPVVLVLEDAHGMRPPMLDLIERLAARARHGPSKAMILTIARPSLIEDRPDWGAGATNHTMLRLEPLSTEDAIELARQSSGGQCDLPAAETIAARTGGNPFFIVEITGMLVRNEEGVSSEPGALPATVQALVAARIDHLSPHLRDLARRVSVFLYSFDPHELAFVGDGDAAGLQELEDEEILVRIDVGGAEPRWRYRHETLRDVAYASLPKRERVRLHVSIAEGLGGTGHVSWGADHLERAALASLDLDPDDRTIPERAADALADAGDRARRRMENRSSLDYYERALAMAGTSDTWGVREARVLAGMGESRYWLGDYQAAIDVLDRALDVKGARDDAWTLAHALRFRGDIAMNFEGDVDRAEQLLERSLAAAEELGEPYALSRTLLFAGWVPWGRGDFEEAERLWKRALVISEDNDDRWARVRALTSLSINRADQGDRPEATRLIEEAQEVAADMGDQFSTAVTAVQRGRMHQDDGELSQAIERFDQAIAIFTELGARWELADATAERGITYRELGRLDDAENDLQLAIRISQELGERQLASWTWRAFARVAQRRGDRAEAEERFRRADEEEARRPR